MPSTCLIAFNGTRENGQFLGDQLCSIKAAYLFAQNVKCDKYLISMSPGNEMHFLWQKFIDDFKCDVVYDTWNPGDMPTRWENWTQWHRERNIEGRPFGEYRELYRRIDGSHRQGLLCGGENGLRRKNIFEYFYYGQENYRFGEHSDVPVLNIDHFGDELIYHKTLPSDRGVLIAPHAKCQGNHVFTFEFWERVVRRLIDAGITITVNYNGNFCEDLAGHPLLQKVFPDFKGLLDQVCRHKLVCCGNTGVGWLAAACGIPLLAMQPENSNMPDYRYEQCGVKSLLEIVDTPDADYVSRRIVEEVNRVLVFTTGCYDVLHAGHVRHLDESKSLGTKLVVALNSDASVKTMKGDGRPVNNQSQRETVLRALRSVDDVIVFVGADALAEIKKLKPDVITNGCDHALDSIVGKEFVESYGGRVVVTSGTRDQSSTNIIRRTVIRQSDILKAVQDASGVSVNPFAKLKLLADEYLKTTNLFGDVADVGAYRGACSLILKRLAPHKRVHVFDTWIGTPFNDDLCHHKKGEWVAPIHECKSLVGVDDRTIFHEGIFPDTASDLNGQMFSFVVIDPDTYQTVRDAIEFFWPRLVTGGKLFFDDYGWEPCAGVKKAVDEKFDEGERVVYESLHSCVVVKK